MDKMKLHTIVWATQFIGTNSGTIPTEVIEIKNQIVNGIQFNPLTPYVNTTNTGDSELEEVPGYLFAQTTMESKTCLVPLANVKKYIVNEVTYYTQLDLELINAMGDILDLSDIIPNELGTNLHQKFAMEQEHGRHTAWIDTSGTCAILDTSLAILFKEKFNASAKETVNCFKTARLFQGAFPSVDLDKQALANLTTGGRLFLYRMNLKIHDGTTVPFIGIAIFSEAAKIFKYNNSKNVLKYLTGFTKGRTRSMLSPENFRHDSLGAGQYYEDAAKLLDKANKSLKWDTIDTRDIQSSCLPQLKIFAATTELAHRPTTKAYLDLKRKREMLKTDQQRLQYEIDKLEGDIERSNEAITAYKERINSTQQRLEEAIGQVEANTATRTKNLSDIAPLSKILATVDTQVSQLAVNYKESIKKEWPSITGLPFFNEWRKMGMLIKELTIAHKTSGAIITDEATIAQIFAEGQQQAYKIAKLVIWTTAPTRIIADGQESGGTKKEYAAGPYIITIQDGTMGLRLLDDRSVRATWSDGSYRIFKIHPHTSQLNKNESDFKKDPIKVWKEITEYNVNVCVGDLGPALLKGSSELDLRLIMWGVKGWLENAVTADSWGRSVTYFPLAEKVKFEQFGVGTREINGETLYDNQIVQVNSEKKQAFIYLTCSHKLTTITCECETTETEWRLTVKADETISYISEAEQSAALEKVLLEMEAAGFKQVLKEKDAKEAKLLIPVPPPVPESPQKKLTEAKIAELRAYIASLPGAAATP